MKKLLMIALVLALAVPAAAATVNLTTTGDTYLDSSVPNNNNGNNGVGVSDSGTRIAMLHFTLPGDFAGMTVNLATLYLARVEAWQNTPDPNTYVHAHQITDTATWAQGIEEDAVPDTEAGATHNKADGYNNVAWSDGNFFDQNDGSIGASVDSDLLAANTDNSLDVTTIFQSWADGNLNNGIALVGTGGTTGITTWYASLEYSGGTYGAAPYVVLEYVPEPATLFVLAVGAGLALLKRRR